MKSGMLYLVNAAIGALLAGFVFDHYIISGYKILTLVAVITGAIIGTILATQKTIKSTFSWIFMGIAIVGISFAYASRVDSALYIPPWETLLWMVALMMMFIMIGYLLTFFELFVVKLFPK